MSIKFSCPHCSKALNVKDHLAGKKAQCPACKKVLTIPTPNKPGSHEVEALAAEAFADEEKRIAAQPTAKMEFQCPMCDEKISVNAALAGKQAPCPECRRIIKVPLPKKEEAKDWRQIDTRATVGIRLNEVKGLEGTWGTDSAAKVSRQALVEAKVIQIDKEPIGWQGWLKRSTAVAASVGILALVTVLVLRATKTSKREHAYQQAMAAVDEKPSKLPPSLLAVAHRLAGNYYLQKNNQIDLENARTQFQTARELIDQGEAAAPAEHDLSLIGLASDQIGLGGDKAEIEHKVRFKWDEVEKQLRQTVKLLQTADGKRVAIRSLTRQLTARGEGLRGAALAASFPEDKVELESIAGLELLRAKMNKEAETFATSAQLGLKPAVAAIGKPTAPTPTAPSALLALQYGLGQANKVRAQAPEASASAEEKTKYQIGAIWGLGLDGKLPPALAGVRDLAKPADKIQALAGLAEIADDAGLKDEARAMVEDASKVAEAEKGKDLSPWALWSLAAIAGRLGAGDAGQIIARNISDPSLRQQAFIDQLPPTTMPDQLEAALGAGADKNSAAYALALSATSRHQANKGDAAALQKAIPTWEPEKLRPFGYLGLALGLQEHNQ